MTTVKFLNFTYDLQTLSTERLFRFRGFVLRALRDDRASTKSKQIELTELLYKIDDALEHPTPWYWLD